MTDTIENWVEETRKRFLKAMKASGYTLDMVARDMCVSDAKMQHWMEHFEQVKIDELHDMCQTIGIELTDIITNTNNHNNNNEQR